VETETNQEYDEKGAHRQGYHPRAEAHQNIRRKKMMKRKSMFFLVCLLLISILINCGKKEQTITINVIGEDASVMQGLEKIKDEFEAEFGYKVAINKFEFNTSLSKTINDLAAGTGQYDVIMGIFYNLGKYAENGFILELGPYMDDSKIRDKQISLGIFYKPVLDISCMYKNKLYGLPCSNQMMFMWYRKDLFNHPEERSKFKEKFGYELPIPSPEQSITWAQYRDLAEFFTRKKGEKLVGEILENDFYGTLIQGKRHPALWYEFNNYLYSFGGKSIDDSGNIAVNSPEVIEALEFYISMKKYSPPGVSQYTWDDAITAFQQELVAFGIMWCDSTPAVENETNSKVAGKMGYGLNPHKEGLNLISSIFGGWGFYVNSKSKHPKEAFQFIQWANRPSVQLKWAQSGGIPGTVETYKNPDYLAIPYIPAQQASLQHLFSYPRIPQSEQLNSKAQEALSRAVAGEQTPKEALDWLAEEWKKILNKE
jgi:multiple sugar transport system substrate-binding protein